MLLQVGSSFDTIAPIWRSSTHSGFPTGCEILKADDLAEWIFSLKVLGESLYAGGEPSLAIVGHDTRAEVTSEHIQEVQGVEGIES